MGKRVWSAEEEAWLRAAYPHEIMPVLLDRFEERFGRRPSVGAMWQKSYKLGLCKSPRDVPDRVVQKVVWSRDTEKDRWMHEHDVGQAMPELSYQFEQQFGFPLSKSQISIWRAKNGKQSRNNRGGGRPVKPIGTERICKGMVLVKVAMYPTVPLSKDNWRYKHYVEYEKAYGPIPKGCDVMACNHDRLDCRPENLLAVPHELMALLNSPTAPEYHDRESLKAAVVTVSLERGIRAAEKALPRRCEVCGRMFTPDPTACNDAHFRYIKTCPDCRARGKKARGTARSLIVKTCKVCGKQFQARQKNQVRCWDCIAKAPKYGAAAQASRKTTRKKKKTT